MSILRKVEVYWKCRGCGREGVYTTWDMDADPTSINRVVQQKRELSECAFCTDGVEDPPPDPSWLTNDELVKAIVNELKRIAGEVELIKKRLKIARIEGKL